MQLRIEVPEDNHQYADVTNARIEQLETLAARMHQESPNYSRTPMREDAVKRIYEMALMEQIVLLILVDESTDSVVGFFAGYIEDSPIVDMKIAYEMLFFVDKSARNRNATGMLVKRFETWAKMLGANRVVLSTTSGVRVVALGKLLEQLGYTTVGLISQKQVT